MDKSGNMHVPLSPVVEVAMVMHRMMTTIEAADRADRAELETVAQVLGGIVKCIVATDAWQNNGKIGPQPQYIYAPTVFSTHKTTTLFSLSSYTPVQLLLLANAVGALLLCGGVLPGVPLPDIQAAAHAALVASKLGSMAALQAGLFAAARGGAVVGPQGALLGGLTQAQMQVAVACIYKLLCQSGGVIAPPVVSPNTQYVASRGGIPVQRPMLQAAAPVAVAARIGG